MLKLIIMNDDIKKRFLTNTDETGRFVVKSLKTGICYYVECIGSKHSDVWGDYDPASKTFTGNYGNKYSGCVSPDESLITESNGFKNIVEVEGSPLSVINERDKMYEMQMKAGTYRKP